MAVDWSAFKPIPPAAQAVDWSAFKPIEPLPQMSADTSRSWGELASDVGTSFKTGATEAFTALTDAPRRAANFVTGEVLPRLANHPLGPGLGALQSLTEPLRIERPEAQSEFMDYQREQLEQDRLRMSGRAAAESQAIADAEGVTGVMGALVDNPGVFLTEGAKMAGNLLPVVAAGPLALPTAGATFGSMAADQVEQQLRADPETLARFGQAARQTVPALREASDADVLAYIADTRATNAGAASALINSILPKMLPGGATLERMATRTMGQGTTRAGNIARGLTGEMGTEAAQGSADQAVQNLATGRPAGQGVLEAGALESMIAGPMGAVAGATQATTPNQAKLDVAKAKLAAAVTPADKGAATAEVMLAESAARQPEIAPSAELAPEAEAALDALLTGTASEVVNAPAAERTIAQGQEVRDGVQAIPVVPANTVGNDAVQVQPSAAPAVDGDRGQGTVDSAGRADARPERAPRSVAAADNVGVDRADIGTPAGIDAPGPDASAVRDQADAAGLTDGQPLAAQVSNRATAPQQQAPAGVPDYQPVAAGGDGGIAPSAAAVTDAAPAISAEPQAAPGDAAQSASGGLSDGPRAEAQPAEGGTATSRRDDGRIEGAAGRVDRSQLSDRQSGDSGLLASDASPRLAEQSLPDSRGTDRAASPATEAATTVDDRQAPLPLELDTQPVAGAGADSSPATRLTFDTDEAAATHQRRIERAARGMYRDAANAPTIKIERAPADGSQADGTFDPKTNTVTVYSDFTPDPIRARFVVAHETTGHYGIRGHLKAQGVDLAPELARARRNPTIAAVADAVAAERKLDDASLSTEEALAELSAADETGNWGEIESRYGVAVPRAMRAGVRAVIARWVQAVRGGFHRAAGDNANFSDADFRKLVTGARRYVRTGKPKRDGANDGAAPLFSFAGKQSATADAEALARAEKLTAGGRSAETARHDTGWFTGSDGQWRYEISDHDATWRAPTEQDSPARELEVEARRSFDESVARGENAGDWRRANPDLAAILRDAPVREFSADYVEADSRFNLSEVLDHKGLFAAYPQLADYRVSFVKASDTRGSFSPRRKEFEVGVLGDKDAMFSTLLHEIQHAIQEIEGFASGGNADADFTASVKARIDFVTGEARERLAQWVHGNERAIIDAGRAAEKYRDALKWESAQRLIGYANRDEPSGVFRLIRQESQWIYDDDFRSNESARDLQYKFYGIPKRGAKRNARIREIAHEAARVIMSNIPYGILAEFKADPRKTRSMIESLARQSRKADKLLDGKRALEREASALAQVGDGHKYSGPYDIYRHLAGEVEARNTQARQRMTAADRRATPPSQTQDIDAEKIIVVYGGMEIRAPQRMAQVEGGPDPADPDIRRSVPRPIAMQQRRAAGTSNSLQAKLDDWWSSFKESFVDEFNSLVDWQLYTADKLGRALNPGEDARAAETLRHGRYQDQLRLAVRDFFEPVAVLLGDAGLDREGLADYLWWRHAPERHAYLEAKDNTGSNLFAGISPNDARAAIAALDPTTRVIYEQAAAHIDALRKHTLDVLERSGQITTEHRDALLNQFAHYVPLRGLPDGVEPDPIFGSHTPGAARGLSNKSKPVVGEGKMMGRQSRPSDILEEMKRDLEAALVGAEKQRVLARMVNLIVANPEIGRIDPVDTEKRERNGVIEYVPVKGDARTQVTFLHKGRPVKLEFSDPALTRAALNMNEPLPDWLRKVAKITRWLSMVKTSLSPYFMLINPVRDAAFAGMGLGAEHGGKVLADAAKVYPQVWAALWRDRAGRGRNSVIDRHAREFAARGGKTGYTLVNDIDAITAELNRLFVVKGRRSSARKVAYKTLDLLETSNDVAESSARLAAYIALRNAGKSADDAALYAKNVTVNFNRKGRVGKHLNAAYMFFNAAVQGSTRFAKLMTNPKFAGAMAGLTSIAYAAALAQMMAAGDDEDGESKYLKQIRDTDAQRAIPIRLGDENYFTIPVPYGPNILTYLGWKAAEVTYAQMRGKTVKPGRVAGELLNHLASSMSPIQTDKGLTALMPEAVKIATNMYFNESDFGGPINYATKYLHDDDNRSRAEMGDERTGAAYYVIARAVNAATGGDKYEAGLLSPTPEHVRYLAEQGLGGLLRFAGESEALAEKLISSAPVDARDVPLSNVFLRSRNLSQQQSEVFYDHRSTITNAVNAYKRAVEGGDTQRADKLKRNHPWLDGAELQQNQASVRRWRADAADVLLRAAERDIKALRDERDSAYTGVGDFAGMNRAQRMAEVRRIDREIADRQREFNAAVSGKQIRRQLPAAR